MKSSVFFLSSCRWPQGVGRWRSITSVWIFIDRVYNKISLVRAARTTEESRLVINWNYIIFLSVRTRRRYFFVFHSFDHEIIYEWSAPLNSSKCLQKMGPILCQFATYDRACLELECTMNTIIFPLDHLSQRIFDLMECSLIFWTIISSSPAS